MQQAAEYANLGWSVLPVHSLKDGLCTCRNPECKSPGKHPVLMNWQHKASNDSYQIAKWMSQYKSKNIGIATGKKSNLIVLDLDIKNGGIDEWTKLEKRYGKSINATLCAKTGSGGRHYYYEIHEGITLKNTQSKLAPGIDTRANGGFVVGANSIHKSGKQYQWSDGLYRPTFLPDSLYNDLKELEVKSCTKSDKTIKIGTRNDNLFRLAAQLRGQGSEFEEIINQLKVENSLKCELPLSDSELINITDSVVRYGKGAHGLKNLFRRSVFKSRNLSSGAKLGLYTLLEHADLKSLTAFPSQEILAEEASQTPQTISKNLNEACQAGFLEISKKPRQNKPGYRHNYQLILRASQCN